MTHFLTTFLPAFVGVIYLVVAGCHYYNKNFVWAWIWMCYALANFGMAMAGKEH